MRARGFTLLEVMVAIAILGLGLTTILSAQAGAFKAAHHARNINLAVGLTRCKMSELEEHLNRDGFQLTDEIDQGPCCDGDAYAPILCSWKIEAPQLPSGQSSELDLGSSLGVGDLGALGALSGLGSTGSGSSPSGGLPSGLPTNMNDLATMLASANQQSAAPLGLGQLPDAGSAGLMQGKDDVASSGMSASPAGFIAQLVMSLVYPDLKALFEASSRRITVTATWREGGKDYSIDAVQWFVSPQLPGPDQEDADAGDLSTSSSSTGTSGGRTPLRTTGATR